MHNYIIYNSYILKDHIHLREQKQKDNQILLDSKRSGLHLWNYVVLHKVISFVNANILNSGVDDINRSVDIDPILVINTVMAAMFEPTDPEHPLIAVPLRDFALLEFEE